jgi:hypothetical protein
MVTSGMFIALLPAAIGTSRSPEEVFFYYAIILFASFVLSMGVISYYRSRYSEYKFNHIMYASVCIFESYFKSGDLSKISIPDAKEAIKNACETMYAKMIL